MPGIDVDLALFPLVSIVNHEGSTDADYVALLAAMTKLVDRRDKFVVVARSSGFAFPGPSQRKLVAEWMPTVKGRMEYVSVGCAMIMTSAIQRGAITALNWIVGPQVPLAAFDDRAGALAWCRTQLENANVPISRALAKELATLR